MRAPTLLLFTGLCTTFIATSLPANAELFRWVDERGVVNYSNRAPAKSPSVKDMRVVSQDRLSVYTPDRETLEMVKRVRERGDFWPRRDRMGIGFAPGAQAPMLPSQDACLSRDDVNCYHQPVYYAYPGYFGGGVPRFQRVLPRGASAGNVVGVNGFTAGLSAQAQSLAPGTRFTRPLPLGTSGPLARGFGGHRSR